MQRITFTNAAWQSMVLANARPYIITSIAGTGAAETDVQIQKAPFQDGQTYIDSLLEPRTISLEVAILASNQEELFQHRREMVQVFNPKLGPGTLRYEYDGGEKEIKATVELAPVFPAGRDSHGPGFQRALVTLLCPSPFWLDTITSSEEMADWIGGLAFPLQLPMMFAGRSSRQYKVVYNAGDVEAPIIFEFTGEAENPKVINIDTGEFIKVNRTLALNEKMIINTEFGNKSVILQNLETGEETNAFGWVDLNSTFFQLRPGNNIMGYDADAGRENARVWIRWRNRYVGV